MLIKSQVRLFFILIAMGFSATTQAQKALADSLIKKELLQHYVQALAHDSMQGRYTGTTGCKKAAAFIAEEMKAIGLSALYFSDSNYNFHYNIKDHSSSITAANIIGALPGKLDGQYIIFSAHYDHVGDANEQELPTQFDQSATDKIYNGANDNASGISAMLSIARYFKAAGQNDYGILFIAFSGEENGLLGSKAMAQFLINKIKIKQVINLEMLGRLSARNKKPFVTEGRSSYGFLKKLNSNLKKMDADVKNNFFQNDWHSNENYFARSDNYSFAIKGIPANTIMATTGFDKYYHTAFDEWHTLNYDNMTTIVKAIALGCTPFVSASK